MSFSSIYQYCIENYKWRSYNYINPLYKSISTESGAVYCPSDLKHGLWPLSDPWTARGQAPASGTNTRESHKKVWGGGLFSFLHSVNVLYIDESLSKLAVVCLSAQSERVPLHTVSSRLWERRRKFTMFPLMQRENKDWKQVLTNLAIQYWFI